MSQRKPTVFELRRMLMCVICFAAWGVAGALYSLPVWAQSTSDDTVLRVGGYRSDVTFLNYVDQYGVHQGLEPEILRAIANPHGMTVRFKGFRSISGAYRALDGGDIDVLTSYCNDDRVRSRYWLSKPYSIQQVGVAIAQDRPAPHSIAALDGLRIAITSGSAASDKLKKVLLHARFIEVNDPQAALNAVASGAADAFVDIQSANMGMIGSLALGSLKSVALPLTAPLCFVARRTDTRTAAIIGQGLALLSQSIRSEIQVQPQPLPTQSLTGKVFALTPLEQQWVREHPLVRVGVQGLNRPYDFMDDQNAWHGLGAMLLKHFALVVHVRVEPVLLPPGNRAPIVALENGAVDVVASFPVGGGPLPKGIMPTRAYDQIPWSFVRLQRHAGAITRVATIPWRMERLMPTPALGGQVQIVPRDTAAEALRAVLAGNADAALVNTVAAADLSELTRGQLIRDTILVGIERIGFGVSGRDAPLADMLDRYLASYSPHEIEQLAAPSRRISVLLGYDKSEVLKISIIATAIALFIVSMLSWAYRRTRAAKVLVEHAHEQAVQARERAQAADRAKSIFMAMMSHEIRTPMNGVVGVLDLLDTLPATPQQKHYLNVAGHSARLMLRVIDDTLDYAKIEEGKLVLESMPFDLNELVAAVIELHTPLAQRKALPLYLAAMPHFDCQIMGDEARMNQILTNLLNNAIRFTTQGYVMLEARHRVIREKSFVELVVSDTGAGITQSYLEHLFTPFTQQDSSTTRRYGGTGLGLSIVKRLVDLMGGTIDVMSRVGQGTRFCVRLPITWAKQQRSWPQCGSVRRARIFAPVTAMDTAIRATLLKMGIQPVAQAPAHFDITVDRTGALVIVSAGTDGEHVNHAVDIKYQVRSIQSLIDAMTAIDHAPVQAESPPAPTQPLADDVHEALFAPALPETAPLSAVQTQSEKILVVEDNEINREIIQAQLEALGMQVVTAIDGVDGYECWQRLRPRLMLVDCHMPRMDGYTLARHIRAAEAQCDALGRTMIVSISANATQTDAQTCREAGMDDYLSKPITRQKLAAILERWMGKTDAHV